MTGALALHLLRTVSVPHLAAHRLRTALTVVGVALGVATVIGIADVSESVLASFRHMVRTIAGDAELEVTDPGGGLKEDVVERAATVPGVQAAAGIIETFVPLTDDPAQSLYLLGLASSSDCAPGDGGDMASSIRRSTVAAGTA